MSNKNTTTRLPRRAMRAPLRWTITRTAYNAIRDTVGSLPAESGSMLGGDQKRRRISHVHFDEGRKRTSVLYMPNEAALNAVRRKDWSPKGIELCGFVHSHPRRTIGTPLLVKGLEFDHAAVLWDPEHFSVEGLYVAITRASKSLTIVSRSRDLVPEAT